MDCRLGVSFIVCCLTFYITKVIKLLNEKVLKILKKGERKMKELFDVLIVVMVARFMWKGFRFFTKKDKRYKKSILGKIGLLFSRSVHNKLDRMIVKQKENLAKKENTQQEKGNNVIELGKYKRVKGN
jgi:hypothetical protein